MLSYVNYIRAEVSTWRDVNIGNHRYGGIEFTVRTRELGHMHENGTLDIPFGKPLKAQLVAERKATPHYIYPDSGWVTYQVQSWPHIYRAVWLLKLSYFHKLLDIRRYSNEVNELLKQPCFEDLYLSQDVQLILERMSA